MEKQYFEAIYPARDGRTEVSEDEIVARLAAKIIRGEDDLIWHAESQGLHVPEPNHSARIQRRERISPSGEWVTVRGSKAFFAEVAEFARELREAGFA